jgi:hypothetical protein
MSDAFVGTIVSSLLNASKSNLQSATAYGRQHASFVHSGK